MTITTRSGVGLGVQQEFWSHFLRSNFLSSDMGFRLFGDLTSWAHNEVNSAGREISHYI